MQIHASALELFLEKKKGKLQTNSCTTLAFPNRPAMGKNTVRSFTQSGAKDCCLKHALLQFSSQISL
ncbi:CLUMA_CG012438, isoform A [Clunio marinus]|uniref:CLUMA_CG012438, isoform A n=1 Tax=Clunio marinus TaxID=568069 RepID=A0A1J1IJS6_9DIPT|nr:CLUMA_CG012438, isoform A [Clunio marinus]